MFYISGFCLCFFIDFCAAVISPLFWLLHPRTFSTWTCRYKHGGNEQQSEERGCMYTDRPHVLLVVEFTTSSSLHPSYFFLPLCLFSVSRSLCVVREVCFPTQIHRPFRCLLPAVCGHSTTGYGSRSAGCGLSLLSFQMSHIISNQDKNDSPFSI